MLKISIANLHARGVGRKVSWQKKKKKHSHAYLKAARATRIPPSFYFLGREIFTGPLNKEMENDAVKNEWTDRWPNRFLFFNFNRSAHLRRDEAMAIEESRQQVGSLRPARPSRKFGHRSVERRRQSRIRRQQQTTIRRPQQVRLWNIAQRQPPATRIGRFARFPRIRFRIQCGGSARKRRIRSRSQAE